MKTLAQARAIRCYCPASCQGRNRQAGNRLYRICQLPVFSPTCCANTRRVIRGVALRLEENVPSGQDLAFDRGDIDIGFTRPPSADRSSSYESRLIFREPLVVALPKARKVKQSAFALRISQLSASLPFNVQARRRCSDTIIRACNDNGFSPRLHSELNICTRYFPPSKPGKG